MLLTLECLYQSLFELMYRNFFPMHTSAFDAYPEGMSRSILFQDLCIQSYCENEFNKTFA